MILIHFGLRIFDETWTDFSRTTGLFTLEIISEMLGKYQTHNFGNVCKTVEIGYFHYFQSVFVHRLNLQFVFINIK